MLDRLNTHIKEVADFVNLCEEIGFRWIETVRLVLSCLGDGCIQTDWVKIFLYSLCIRWGLLNFSSFPIIKNVYLFNLY